MKPYYQDEWVTIYNADCREVLPDLPRVDLVLTDPPYPDQHLEYGDCDISFLDNYECRQLVFWSAKADFQLDYTAIHIWDKQTGCASEYERIFERNGDANFKMFRTHLIGNQFAATLNRDIFTGHPSQKPIKLIKKLIGKSNIIFDPFMGSGTTLKASKDLNRHCIGIEIEEKYCEIAAKRCSQQVFDLSGVI